MLRRIRDALFSWLPMVRTKRRQRWSGDGLPTGPEFLELVRQQEDKADKWSQAAIRGAGEKAPELYKSIGQMLLYMDLAGSCWWGCTQGDHRIEYLIGGSSGTARAALRLSLMAFYDESLTLARSIGERANLLTLFVTDRSALDAWRGLDSEGRRREFAAVRVRLRIEEGGKEPPISQERYQVLSQHGVHPGRAPQQMDPSQPPKIGAIPDLLGLVTCLNEIGTATILVMGLGVSLLENEGVPRKDIMNFGIAAAHHLGGVDVLSVPDLLQSVRPASPE